MKILVLALLICTGLNAHADISLKSAKAFIKTWYGQWDTAANDSEEGQRAQTWLVDHVSEGDNLLMTFRVPVTSKTILAGFLDQIRMAKIQSVHELNLIKKIGEDSFRYVVSFVTHADATGTDFNGTTLIDVKLSELDGEIIVERYIVRVLAPLLPNPTFELKGTVLNQDVLL